jgi:hypothetical protein
MKDHSELWAIGLLVGLVLFLILLVLLHRRRLNQISDQLSEGAVDNGETLKHVVERENAATREHVSLAVDSVRSDTKFAKERIIAMNDRQKLDANEIRGQIRALRERFRVVVEVTDKLLKRLEAIPAQVGEWLSKKRPP